MLPSGSTKRLAAVVLIAALMGAVVTTISGSAGAAGSGQPWGVKLVTAGGFSDLTVGGGNLYAIRDGTWIVQINPSTGKLIASSRAVPSADSLVYADGSLWATGSTLLPSKGAGLPVLQELSSVSLRKEREVVYKSAWKPIFFNGPPGQLWGYGGWTKSPVCTVRQLNPATGATLLVYRLPRGTGECAGVAFDTAWRDLYVVTGGGGGNLALYKLDGRSGAILGHSAIPTFSNFVSIVATPQRVWIAGGDPGAPGGLLYLTTGLRLLAESPTVGNGPPPGVSQLPNFSQFASVDYSGGRVWAASDGTVACFSPSSRKVIALYVQHHAPLVTSPPVVTGSAMWAESNNGNPPQNGLVKVTPPASCIR
jgi:hypothetical protein